MSTLKVLCVDLSIPERPDQLLPEDYIHVGLIYTADSTIEIEGRIYYYLVEKPPREDGSPIYNSWRFIPIESILNVEKVYKTKEAISPAELTLYIKINYDNKGIQGEISTRGEARLYVVGRDEGSHQTPYDRKTSEHYPKITEEVR